jgi:hypothetical protein
VRHHGGRPQVVEYDDRSSLRDQLQQMARTPNPNPNPNPQVVEYNDRSSLRNQLQQMARTPNPNPNPQVVEYNDRSSLRNQLQQMARTPNPNPNPQVVEYDDRSSLRDQLQQMARTGLFVSVHTSNLANSPLLGPGAAVLEIIQRHWVCNGLDTSFRDQTSMMCVVPCGMARRGGAGPADDCHDACAAIGSALSLQLVVAACQSPQRWIMHAQHAAVQTGGVRGAQGRHPPLCVAGSAAQRDGVLGPARRGQVRTRAVRFALCWQSG